MCNLYIEKLQVINFRNLQNDIISFNNGINLIFGNNGNGKTNILEAIHIITHKKSFKKSSTFADFLNIDSEQSEIILSSVLSNHEKEKLMLKIQMNINESIWTKDENIKNVASSLSIFINPFDSYQFFYNPSFRRKWIDDHISYISKEYKRNLVKYNTALKFRNTLLSRKTYGYLEQIDAIDKELINYGSMITHERVLFTKEIEQFLSNIFKKIFSEDHQLDISLNTKLKDYSPENFFKILVENRNRDLKLGHTSYGIHRDDYVLHFDNVDLINFCSLGQQKMAFLSLLFAYIELIRYKFVMYPIVLVDDVSGELDMIRWKKFIDYLEQSSFQTIITTANNSFKNEIIKLKKINQLIVNLGKITNV